MSVISDGENATRLLEDEFLKRVLNELREDYKNRIMQTQRGDQELRDEIYFDFQAIKRFEEKLKTYRDRKSFLKKRVI